MARPVDIVEVAFDGTNFIDVTDQVRGFSVSRGKSRELDEFQAGSCTIVLENNSRDFDPTNDGGPYFGNILPLRPVRITTNSIVQFVGTIDDWDLNFSPAGDNTATIAATDRQRIIANQALPARTNVVQLSGERVDEILDDINWPALERDIDLGAETLGADTIELGASALAYLQQVAESEAGAFYIAKNGFARFRDRRVVPSALSPLLADDGTGIPYSQLEIIFGSELLYNQIIFTNQITTNTSVANQLDSQGIYGVQTFQRDNLLMATDTATQDIADFLANKYGQPAFRFEAITIRLNDLSPTEQNQILGLDFGDVVEIVFRPGNPPTGSPINEFAEVIAIEQSADPAFHQVKLKFNTLNGTSLILDDAVFGRLDVNALAF
jgi:hypothetical protein